MAEIFIEFKGHGLKDKKVETVTTNNVKTVKANFKFDSEWDEFKSKIAIFTINDCVAYQDYLDENDQCVVPWEVLTNPEVIYISVIGLNDDKTYTSVLVPIKIYQGGKLDAILPSDPEINFINQLSQLKEQVTQLQLNMNNLIGEPDAEGKYIMRIDGGHIQRKEKI